MTEDQKREAKAQAAIERERERAAFSEQFPGWLSPPPPEWIEEKCGWPSEPTEPTPRRNPDTYAELGD